MRFVNRDELDAVTGGAIYTPTTQPTTRPIGADERLSPDEYQSLLVHHDPDASPVVPDVAAPQETTFTWTEESSDPSPELGFAGFGKRG